MPDEIRNILRELKKGLTEIFGESLKSVILFGSYARGDAHPPDSDIDVMIVLKGEFDSSEVDKRSSKLMSALCLKNDVLISWRFTSDTYLAQSGAPLMINIRKEGVAI